MNVDEHWLETDRKLTRLLTLFEGLEPVLKEQVHNLTTLENRVSRLEYRGERQEKTAGETRALYLLVLVAVLSPFASHLVGLIWGGSK